MYQRAKLKREVKQTIASTRPRPMWVALLYMIIASIGASIISGVINGLTGVNAFTQLYTELLTTFQGDVEAAFEKIILTYAGQLFSLIGTLMAASLITSILCAIWNGLMTVGFTGYCLDLVKGEKPAVGKIFCGFSRFGKVIATSFLRVVFTALWSWLYMLIMMVFAVVGTLFMESVPAAGGAIMLAGYVLFLFLIVRLYMRYAMTDYILLDTGKYGLEAISESKKMMKGKKGKLFGLHLSFIGWYLLIGVITAVGALLFAGLLGVGGVGAVVGDVSFETMAGMVGGAMFVMIIMVAAIWLISIWLQPYITGSVAKFYLHFKPQAPVEVSAWPTPGEGEESNSGY